jgi:hypothetical protein
MEATVQRYNADPIAEQNWQRYTYGKNRGHRIYQLIALRNENFYLGGGLQWSQADLEKLRETGNRPAYELNGVMPAVNAAIGYQIHNRMDISYLPRGGMADSELAVLRSKVAMQICDMNQFHWKETQVFADGLIEQRGYFDVRMCFDKNIYGDVDIGVLDPRDVIPDPDGKSYDPREWLDVTVTRWYTLDQIEGYYGKEARDKVAAFLDVEPDWGEFDDEGQRNKFGDEGPSIHWDAFLDDEGARHFRILDRQRWKYQMSKVAIYPTGDVRVIDDAQPDQVAEYVAQGCSITKRLQRVVHWTVTTRWVTLHDDVSPYDRFTVLPYYPIFRRGKTRGLVDNAISPQEVLNKAISQFVHIVNGTANSGWVVEQNSLVNMAPEDLEKEGAKPGLLVIYKEGAQKPEKIQPNNVPQGMDRLIEIALQALKDVTVPDAARGLSEGPEVSGIAVQSKQFASQQQLAVPLDNLARTRHMLAEFLDYLMSNFMDNRRVFRITETDPRTGKAATVDYNVNVYDASTGMWSNDLTEGEYDVVISEQPMQATFENSQFMQGLEMRKAGIAVPDNVLIKHSNLADKAEILDQMASTPANSDPLTEAKTALTKAQAMLAQATADEKQATTTNTRVTSLFGAAQTAQVIAGGAALAPLADKLLRSAGFQDQDAAPIVPQPDIAATTAAPALPAPPSNTDPLTPATPATGDVGARAGIEGGQ